ncbi:uncharacterized protein LOC121423935 isoform X3 [Lytechinus variegatus]|uniref:uncharacterized protein LOC121423935 isoform X3 n=1 Tax=Lytechinus variegatus TaxID=7654 RepID=UPI001BB1E658|nr:uncharacterized protein LOC121423935 isoform X3 [Lytechinus variegatus]
MSRDWERNFTNTMRETEDNLSRMRNRLDPARYKPIDSTLIDSPPDQTEQLSNGIPKIRRKQNMKERPVSAILTSSSPSYELYRHSAPSTGLVALLSEKVERQNKVIEQLSHQVQDLESDRRKNDVKVRDLEHQVNTLTARLTENRGQYNQTEQQIADWQRDMRNRLDELHDRITRQITNGGNSDAYFSESALATLARDLHEAKRMLQAECKALHHEIETLRTRLVKQEMDVTGQLMEGKELGRRMDRLDRKIGKVHSDHQQVLSNQLGLSSRQQASRMYNEQKDINDLKMEMSKLLASYGRLESASQVSRSSNGSVPSTVSATTVSSSISSRRHRSYPSSVSSSKGPTVVSSSWQRVGHHHHPDRKKKTRRTKMDQSTGSTSSIEDLSSSEISLPLSISHEEEEEEDDAEKRRQDGGKQLVGDDDEDDEDDEDVIDFQDDLSLYLSDLDVSHKGEEFGSAISLDSGNLDLDFM